MNFNELFGKNVIYDNLTSHKKAGFWLLFRKHIFGQPVGGVEVGLGRSGVGFNHRIFVLSTFINIFNSNNNRKYLFNTKGAFD